MSSNSSNSSKGGGNTISPPLSVKKQISPAKRWCFTLNNWTEDELSSISSKFRVLCSICLIGSEVGDEGTPHLQGYAEFLTKCRPKAHELSERLHWEKCKGNRDANVRYCSKDGQVVFTLGLPPALKLISEVSLYPYQRAICDVLLGPVCDRKIHWFFGPKDIGKTALLKLVCNPDGIYKACILPPTRRHALSQVQKLPLTFSFVFNLTADQSAYQTNEFFSVLESVKDGLFATGFGTDNNSMCVRNSSHIIVVANERPDFSKTEIDRKRFKVHRICATSKTYTLVDELDYTFVSDSE